MSRGGDNIDDNDVDDDDDVDVDGSNQRNLRCSICRGAAEKIQCFKS